MEIFPAIDILGGRVARLTYGDYDTAEIYANSPYETAQAFMRDGASNLHVVDLDGAKAGKPVNNDAILKLCSIKGLFVEVGGGIRTEHDVNAVLGYGASRVILGTCAARDIGFVERMVKTHGDKIAVGVDARGGLVAVSGWQETTSLDSFEFCKTLMGIGISTVIYTDILKDGALSGANLDAYRALGELKGLNIIASGGVTFLSEIKELKSIGTHGVILGKALYTNKLSLKDALIAAGD